MEGGECITLNEAAMPDTLDPYFALILDVFCNGSIPKGEERCRLYGDDVAAFESSGQSEKDRFLIGDIPVRLEFKKTKKIEELVNIAASEHDNFWLIKDSGTYGFYRLVNCEIVYSRTDWINGIRKQLTQIGDKFWIEMRDAVQSKMEHFLADLGAACFQGDKFHYLIASAGFIKSACLTLFCINKHFEPSHRAYFKQVLELHNLPESFAAEFETFLGSDMSIASDSRFHLAKIIAQKIIQM